MCGKPPCLTLHLHQELRLDPSCCLTLVLAPGAAERINLIDEDDRWFVFSGHAEQTLHQPSERTHVMFSSRSFYFDTT